MEKLLTQGKLPLAQIKPRGRLLRAAAGRWEEQKPGRKGEAMCFQTGRLRGQNTLGPDHGVTSLERARRPPFQDAQCGCAPRAHQGRGATGFPRLPSSPDPPIPQRLVAVPRDQLPLPSLQGLPGKTGIPAIPRSPAPAPRVPQSRGWALPPGWDSSAVLCIEEGRKEEGRRGGKRGGRRGKPAKCSRSARSVFHQGQGYPILWQGCLKILALQCPQPLPPAGGLQHPSSSRTTTPASLWEGVWSFSRSRSFAAAFLIYKALGLNPSRDYECISEIEALGLTLTAAKIK